MFRCTTLLILMITLLAACGPADPTPTPVPTAAPTTTAPPTPTTPPTATSAPTATPEPTAPPTATWAVEGNARPSATTSPPPGAVTPGAEALVEPATLQQLNQIEEHAATLRGLKPKTDVPEHFVTPVQIKTNLKQEVADEYPPAEARQDVLELWLLRLIDDRALDLAQLQVDLLGEQVLGYYDPEKNELFVRNDQQPLGVEAQETLAHEFVHSLQDEYYNLEKLRPKHAHDNDRSTAVTALIEGDATLAGVLFAQKYMTPAEFQELIQKSAAAPTEQLDKAPLAVRESLLFPYDKGVQFVSTLYARDRFAAIDKAFRDPPVSSEQILHPEKYLATPRDNPLPVTLPPLTDTLGAGWTLRNTDTLGEFDLDLMLRANGVTDAQATAGWGGARYATYQGNSAALVILETRWDRPKDADEFNAALRESLGTATPTGTLWSADGRFFAVTHSGDKVTFLSGTDEAGVKHVLAGLP